ncbi:hypothetical protein ACU4GD_29010 [Cupriavidus basilensis]
MPNRQTLMLKTLMIAASLLGAGLASAQTAAVAQDVQRNVNQEQRIENRPAIRQPEHARGGQPCKSRPRGSIAWKRMPLPTALSRRASRRRSSVPRTM